MGSGAHSFSRYFCSLGCSHKLQSLEEQNFKQINNKDCQKFSPSVDSCLPGIDAEIQTQTHFFPNTFHLKVQPATIAKTFSSPPKIGFHLICAISAKHKHLMLSPLYIPCAFITTRFFLNLFSSFSAQFLILPLR